MKKSLVLIFLCFNGLMINCNYHSLEKPKKTEKLIPAKLPPIKFPTVNYDGHYSVKFSVLKTNCNNEPYDETYEKIDFVQYAPNRGVLVFDNKFYWDWFDISLNDGAFESQIEPDPFLYNYGFYAVGIELKGAFFNEKLSGTVKEIYFTGDKPDNMSEFCYIKYSFEGKKRYKSLKGPAKYLEGEYNTRVKNKNNSCPFETFLDNFSTIAIPQDDGKINLQIDLLEIYDLLPNKDGKIETTINLLDDSFDFSGFITPNDLSLKIKIKRGGDNNCLESYELEGKKRFAENDTKDKTFDGAYSVMLEMIENTCDNRSGKQRAHFDVMELGSGKLQLKAGAKTWTFTPSFNGNFSAQYQEGYLYLIKNSFSDGLIDFNNLSGKIKIEISGPEIDCYYLYDINGYKLYKHN